MHCFRQRPLKDLQVNIPLDKMVDLAVMLEKILVLIRLTKGLLRVLASNKGLKNSQNNS